MKFSVKKTQIGVLIIISGVNCASATAEDSLAALTNLSLQELLKIQVVSVAKRPEPLSSSPSAVQVITSEQIRRSGATHLAETLRLASNLNVAQQNAHQWVVTSRGFSSDAGNKLLVLMDGRSVYTPLLSGVFWSRQDYLLEDMERIEVVSGPGGTLWGVNAVNGVVNLTSKNAAETQGGYATAAGGNYLENLIGARYGGEIGHHTAYRVYGKYSERNQGELTNGAEGGDAWSMGQLGFRADAEGWGRDQFTLQGDFFTSDTGNLNGGEAETRGGNVLGRWTRRYSADSNFQLQIYFDHTDLQLPVAAFVAGDTTFSSAGTLHDKLDTFDVNFHHALNPHGRHKIVWGFGYRWTYDRVENAPSLGFLPEKLHQDLSSAFIQDEIALLDNLTFTIGSKIEHNDYSGFEYEPSARLGWQINDDHLMWGAISRAVRMPSRADRDMWQPVPPNFVILRGDANFDSEKVVAYEAGYRAWLNQQVIASLALFYNEYADVRSTSITDATVFPLYFANNLEGETHGVELNLKYQPLQWWQLRLGYNYLETNMRVKAGAFDLNNALNENADPRHQVSLHSAMNISDTVAVDFAYRWIDRLPTDSDRQVVYVPSYGEMNLRLSWFFQPEWEISLVGRNLLHDYHQEFGIPSPTQQEIGRSIFLQLQMRR